MDWLIEPFELAAQQRALLAGCLAAIALAVVGTWVVIRGMTFLGDALAHGIIPGVALALLVDFSLILGAAAAALVMIGGIHLVHRQTAFPEDTGIESPMSSRNSAADRGPSARASAVTTALRWGVYRTPLSPSRRRT